MVNWLVQGALQTSSVVFAHTLVTGLPDIGLAPNFHQTGWLSVRGKLLFESNVSKPPLSSFHSGFFSSSFFFLLFPYLQLYLCSSFHLPSYVLCFDVLKCPQVLCLLTTFFLGSLELLGYKTLQIYEIIVFQAYPSRVKWYFWERCIYCWAED